MWYCIGSLWSKANASTFYGITEVLTIRFYFTFFQIGISLSYAIWCVSFNLTIFIFARLVSGLSKANVAIILAIVSDTTKEKDRNRAMVRK